MSGSTTRQRSYQATDETDQVLQELREAFKVSTDSAAIRRALGLARVIAREAKDDHTIVIQRKDGTPLQLLLDA
jgi:arginyl-tRNA synthetase